MRASALAGMGKSVVLGLLTRLSVIMAKQAGLAEDGVDERVLWLGRPPSKIGIFADQLEERMAEKLEALSRLKDVEHILRALQMKLLHHDKVCISEWQKILPFSTSWWRSCQWPEPGSEQPITATWLTTSTGYEPFLKSVHQLKRQLKAHVMLLMSEVVRCNRVTCTLKLFWNIYIYIFIFSVLKTLTLTVHF